MSIPHPAYSAIPPYTRYDSLPKGYPGHEAAADPHSTHLPAPLAVVQLPQHSQYYPRQAAGSKDISLKDASMGGGKPACLNGCRDRGLIFPARPIPAQSWRFSPPGASSPVLSQELKNLAVQADFLRWNACPSILGSAPP